MTKEIIKNYCTSCEQSTSHDVEGSHKHTVSPDEYHCMIEHAVVKCRGCDTVSFRKVIHDYEAAFPDEFGDWDHPIDVENYPRKQLGNIDTAHLPEIVESIYSETCAAYRDEALTLAGIGFRATIEAICNDQKIVGKELSTRINNLASKGLISKKDSKRLHSIRFLGNDAAHDIKKPTKSSLKAALIIVEHLLTTVYIIDKESKGKLETIIEEEEYSRFEDLLIEKLADFSPGDEYPIQKFLEKDYRRISGHAKSICKLLDTKIGKSEFARLVFGKKAKFQESKEELQHYIVI